MNVLSIPVFNFRVPGEQDGITYVDKQICINADYHIMDRLAITIAPNLNTDLDQGTILGITTADGLFRPVRRYPLTALAASGATSIQVAAAAVLNQGDAVSVMKADGTGVETVGTISAPPTINGANMTVTVSTATAEALAVGDFIYVADGSQTALVILADVVLDAAQNKIASAYVAGKFYQSALIGIDSFAIKDLSARSIPYGNNPVTNQADSILIV